ncbi:hypothetical protein P5673_019941 [Acropora cervicornis]|uniref:Uncharacterized protein n=1 Tax=Acropora cervicornis TaxID=6130 RepID=A0AAD9QA91_ACRCE|nr:hypothetical protein P5673_019941 [Acropora cervicornis]
MDHKGDVVVNQVQKDKSSCSCHVPLNFEPVEVTRNLLQDEDCTFKVVSPRLFKPWHDIKMLIPLVFKFQPPKLSLDTLQTLKQSSIVNNETPLGQALDLMVFSPGYSGKLCFKLQPGKCSASKYECNNCLTSCRPGNSSWPRSVAVMNDMVEMNKSEEQGFNSSSKSKVQDEVWVYCDFQHSLKVRSTLEKAFKITGALHFHVHPVGVVMQL